MIRLSLEKAPARDGYVGRSFRFVSDTGNLDAAVFFLVPKRFAATLADVAEAILPLAGMVGLVRKEDVRFAGMEVDPLLLRNVWAGLNQTRQWYPEFPVPKLLEIREATPRQDDRPKGAVTLLSGGVDSMFTFYRHSCGNSRSPESALDRDLTHAVHIYHTPTATVDPQAINLGALATSAEDRGLVFFPVLTNMMTFDRQVHDRWSDVAHGAGLATVLHMLSGETSTGLLASSHSFGGLMPWGSSPLIDPLWSGNRMQIVHDGSTYRRVEKTAFIARSPAFIESLNVCDNRIDAVGYVNCSKCQKCLRTMVTLDLFSDGRIEQFGAFDWRGYHPSRIATIFLRTESEKSFIREIESAADGRRPDIVAACRRALVKSAYLRPVSAFEKTVKKSGFGRRNRDALISLRSVIYRSAGWAMKD